MLIGSCPCLHLLAQAQWALSPPRSNRNSSIWHLKLPFPIFLSFLYFTPSHYNPATLAYLPFRWPWLFTPGVGNLLPWGHMWPTRSSSVALVYSVSVSCTSYPCLECFFSSHLPGCLQESAQISSSARGPLWSPQESAFHLLCIYFICICLFTSCLSHLNVKSLMTETDFAGTSVLSSVPGKCLLPDLLWLVRNGEAPAQRWWLMLGMNIYQGRKYK